MSRVWNVTALTSVLVIVSGTAFAQMRDPNIPAGTAGSVLSGTPSGTSPGSLTPRTVPSIGYVAPTAADQSFGCLGITCGPAIIVPTHRGRF